MSKQINDHHEFKPRSNRRKTTRKKVAAVFIILSIAFVFSLGVVSAKMISVVSSGETPQFEVETIETEIKGMPAENGSEENIADEIDSVDKQMLSETIEKINEENEKLQVSEEKLEKDEDEHNIIENKKMNSEPLAEPPLEVHNERQEEEVMTKNEEKQSSNQETETIDSTPKTVIVHEIQPKETLFSITMKYFLNSTYKEKIAEYNGIKNPSTEIKAGMNIKIPDPLIRYHQIESGETLFSITNKYYSTAQYQEQLANYNGIKDPTTGVKLGMELKIPHPSLMDTLSSEGYKVKIDKRKNILTVYYNAEVVRSFSVATGKDLSLTPEGEFKIVNKVEKPWYNPENIRGGDPKNPLGSHWLGLNVPGTNGYIYGIHGTNNPASIGTYVSLGCIRMHNSDIEWLYKTLPLQTPVHISN